MSKPDFTTRVGQWAERTFPQATPVSIARHLQEEAAELLTACEQHAEDLANGCDALASGSLDRIREEAADVQLLLTHLPYRLGFDLQAAAEEKFAVNQGRTWEPVEGGYSKHVAAATTTPTGGAGREGT
jgi:NTP pyrophosphatase (non-canonical NTP hydrolase)